MSTDIKVGSRVQFQNLVGIVVAKDGPNAWLVKPNGSNARVTVPTSQLTVVMNEGHMESSRMEDFRKMMYD